MERESKAAHKMEGVKERGGGGQQKISGPLGPVGTGVGSASVASPLSMGLTLNQ